MEPRACLAEVAWLPKRGPARAHRRPPPRPADVTCNSDRGSLDFDESEFAHAECASRRDADSFEPRDAVKGDVARMLFYMDVRYAGANGVPDLALIDEDSNSGPLLGHLCTLLAWEIRAP
jgi:uncharacterized protein